MATLSQTTGDAAGNYVVTNTNMKTRDIPVTKVWENKEGDSAEIVLYRDGVEVDRVTITKADDWKHNNQPEFYDKTDGHEYAYTISETYLWLRQLRLLLIRMMAPGDQHCSCCSSNHASNHPV